MTWANDVGDLSKVSCRWLLLVTSLCLGGIFIFLAYSSFKVASGAVIEWFAMKNGIQFLGWDVFDLQISEAEKPHTVWAMSILPMHTETCMVSCRKVTLSCSSLISIWVASKCHLCWWQQMCLQWVLAGSTGRNPSINVWLQCQILHCKRNKVTCGIVKPLRPK